MKIKYKFQEEGIMQATLAKFMVFSLFLLLPTTALAQTTWYVDTKNKSGPWHGSQSNPFQYIQDGIDAAVDGDSVLVMPGLYEENIDFNGKAVIVISSKGPRATKISGKDPGSVVAFVSGEGPSSMLSGFTIMNGTGQKVEGNNFGGGIYCFYSSPTIKNNIIENNSVRRASIWSDDKACGGGICCIYSSPTINSNIIKDNKVYDSSWVELSGPDKICAYAFGGGIYLSFSSATLLNNIIAYNEAHVQCTGLNEGGLEHFRYGNAKGGGIFFSHTDSPILYNNTIFGNKAYATNNAQGIGTGYGGGIYYDTSQDGTIKNTVIWENWANNYPQLFTYDNESLTITYSNVQGDYPGEGNMGEAPLFVDPPNRDFHLRLNSPCVDLGSNSVSNYILTDFEGNNRIVDGNWPLDGNLQADIGADELLPEIAARFGNVNAVDSSLASVLLLNGKRGNDKRIYNTSSGNPLTLEMNTSPAGPSPAGFCLYLIRYDPGLSDMSGQPYGIGAACMSMPLSSGHVNPPPVTCVNTMGFKALLGYPILTDIPKAPCTIFDRPTGLPLGTYAFQGIIFDHGSSGKGVSLTNAIVLKVK